MSRFALSRKEEDTILSLCRTEALKACQAEVASQSPTTVIVRSLENY